MIQEAEYRYRLRFSKSPEDSFGDGFKKSRNILKEIFLKNLPLASQKGKGKFSFGPALPRNYFSECEYADVWLNIRPKKEEFEKFFSSLPQGFSLISYKSIPLFFPPVEAVDSIEEYDLYPLSDISGLKTVFEKNLSLSHLEITIEKDTKIRKEDLSFWLYRAVWQSGGAVKLFIKRIKGRSIRPEAVIDRLTDSRVELSRVIKKNIYWIDSSGNLNEI